MINTTIGFIFGFLSGIFSNYLYDRYKIRFSQNKKNYLPTILNDKNSWVNSNGETYSYLRDPEFKIKINEDIDTLASRFKKFPDKEHDRVCWVEVKYGDATLYGWNFMHLDGHRILIPVPDTQEDPEGNYYDFYNLNKLEFKIFEIIGKSIILTEKTKLEGLKNIARILNISVTNINLY